jgi:hypothetical protein
VLDASALILLTVAVSALASYGQIGLRIAPKVRVGPGKLDPKRGPQRIFARAPGAHRAFDGKILLISGAASWVAWLHVEEIVHVSTNELGPLLRRRPGGAAHGIGGAGRDPGPGARGRDLPAPAERARPA